MRSTLRWILPLMLALLLLACNRSSPRIYEPQFTNKHISSIRTYIFGVHPLHNAESMFAIYQPLMIYFNRHLGEGKIKLETSFDYADYEKKIRQRKFDFALPNPYQVIQSEKYGYHVFGKVLGDDDFRGVILTRRDSGVKTVDDLRGRIIAYPSATAVAAALLPQWFFYQHGLNTEHDVTNQYVGSQESAIMNVYLGKSIAGVTWPPPWRAFKQKHPEYAAQLQVQWQTDSLVNNGLIARNDVSPLMEHRVADLLFGLEKTGEGRALIKLLDSRFGPANDLTYQPVRVFLADFEQKIRPVDSVLSSGAPAR